MLGLLSLIWPPDAFGFLSGSFLGALQPGSGFGSGFDFFCGETFRPFLAVSAFFFSVFWRLTADVLIESCRTKVSWRFCFQIDLFYALSLGCPTGMFFFFPFFGRL